MSGGSQHPSSGNHNRYQNNYPYTLHSQQPNQDPSQLAQQPGFFQPNPLPLQHQHQHHQQPPQHHQQQPQPQYHQQHPQHHQQHPQLPLDSNPHSLPTSNHFPDFLLSSFDANDNQLNSTPELNLALLNHHHFSPTPTISAQSPPVHYPHPNISVHNPTHLQSPSLYPQNLQQPSAHSDFPSAVSSRTPLSLLDNASRAPPRIHIRPTGAAASNNQAQVQVQLTPPKSGSQSTMPLTRGSSREIVSGGTSAYGGGEDDFPIPSRRSLRSRAARPKPEPEDDEEYEQAANESEDGQDQYADGEPTGGAQNNEGEDDAEGEDDEEEKEEAATIRTRSGRLSKPIYTTRISDGEDDSEEEIKSFRRKTKPSKVNRTVGDFVENDEPIENEDEEDYSSERPKQGRLRKGSRRGQQVAPPKKSTSAAPRRSRSSRTASARRKEKDEDWEMAADDSHEDDDELASVEDEVNDLHSDDPGGSQGPTYTLRTRKKVNYSFGPPPESGNDAFGNSAKRGHRSIRISEFAFGNQANGDVGGLPSLNFGGRGKKGKEGWDALPMSMTGKDYAQAFGDPLDSSDDELQQNAMRKPGAGPALLGGSSSGGQLGAAGGTGGLTGSGPTDSFGRIKKSSDPLADIDPLGVDVNIGFDSVGGLDHHIQQLKEMVMLPLLYPEVFQRFKVMPPRGVLFHGPPGTGKTLVARALAASCSSEGQQVSFFMRKGADCLSKWVGEAERQLRLLFEEARNSQPSIIFFDEIDGLAPVRSSKQDQIHASIVSTMLALMDGMDDRGQVVVIGATNRPDSVDPALRRPGRFDREFYFPLPSLDARKSIIDIHTRKWEPPLDDSFKQKLAEVTKGYGGADLRALCTEAALNAIQRRYPQIYQTTDRLLLDPSSIQVDAKDFMMSVNKVVPSSARSTASAAAPLPERLKPLLEPVVKDAIAALERLMPPVSKRNPLEEALWEDDVVFPGSANGLSSTDLLGGDRGFGREMLLQSFEAQRVFRPRMLVYGQEGMGQSAVGSALLQHLEGYHVQSLDLGTLLGDSARTPEAAVIQLFVETKRHKPSVIYIPGLVHWARSVSESVKTTFKALLDGLTDSDPILLLGIAEGRLEEIEPDVQSWFNYVDQDMAEIPVPQEEQRRTFYKEIFDHVVRPPTEFPDALPRRQRKLEQLPKAPPRPPRKLTQIELQKQAEDDAKLLEHLKYRLGPVLAELRKKFKKFTREVWDEYNLDELTQRFDWRREKGKIIVTIRYNKPARIQEAHPAEVVGDVNGTNDAKDAAATENHHLHAANGEGPEIPSSDIERQNDTTVIADATVVADIQMQSSNLVADAEAVEVHSVGINGHIVHPPSDVPPQDATVVTMEQGAAAATHANGTATTDKPAVTTSDNGDYVLRDLHIWNMNLEKMQKRLYYNSYLSCQAFMTDVAKIASNAEEAAEVDSDRAFRAHQMRNLAIVLMDQHIDANFREECDRMAQRKAAREAELREATQKATTTSAEAVADGEKQPTTTAAEECEAKPTESKTSEPEEAASTKAETTPDDVAGMDRKRSRTSDSANSNGEAMDVDAQQESKRARLEGDLPNGSLDMEQRGSSQQPRESSVSALPLHPPFVVDHAMVEALFEEAVNKTANFNIEQLGRLRAAWFNQVWAHRADWDRSRLVEKLKSVFDQLFDAVSRERERRIL